MKKDCLSVLKSAIQFLEKEGIENPGLNAEQMLGSVLKLNRVDLYLSKDRRLTSTEIDKFNSLLGQRLYHKPLQYILGSCEFMGLEFKVNQDVMIPRPETEILTQTVLDFFKKKKKEKLKIVDLGTGSGAIAISLAKNLENALVYATDISKKALKIAKKNAQTNKIVDRIKFLCGDLSAPLENLSLFGLVDCVVSNPPYVKEDEFENLPEEIKNYEPKVALLCGEDGLEFHRRIIKDSVDYLKKDSLLALEVALGQADKVSELVLSNKSYRRVEIKKDLAGIDRIVKAEKGSTDGTD